MLPPLSKYSSELAFLAGMWLDGLFGRLFLTLAPSAASRGWGLACCLGWSAAFVASVLRLSWFAGAALAADSWSCWLPLPSSGTEPLTHNWAFHATLLSRLENAGSFLRQLTLLWFLSHPVPLALPLGVGVGLFVWVGRLLALPLWCVCCGCLSF